MRFCIWFVVVEFGPLRAEWGFNNCGAWLCEDDQEGGRRGNCCTSNARDV